MDTSRYRVIRRIGRGGMAEVLEAVAIGAAGFERRVALKRMLPHEGDAEREHRMFLDEARIASHLHHANIVAVLDYGLADGRPFQVLEYVDGTDVRLLLEHGPLPIALALHIALEVGHALDHAHSATDATGRTLGIVHRDVTPANILVSRAGDVKLTDFGIAFAHAKLEHTLAGTTKGTPWFMSPEQMMGDPTDGRSDVFSLGCVLHMMMTGASPLERQSQQIDVASGAEVELATDVPPDVRAIIERATRHAASARYATARELVAALAEVAANHRLVDPRTALREYIDKVEGRPSRPAMAPAQPGKLDAFLDLALILDGSDAREFHTVAPAPSNEQGSELETKVEKRRAVPAPPRRSRATIVAVLGFVALALAAGALLVARHLRASEPTAVVTEPVRLIEPPDATELTRLELVPDSVEVVRTELTVDAAVAVVPPPVIAKKKRPAEAVPAPSAQTQRWIQLHSRASETFASWATENPRAAGALRAWEAKTGRGNELIRWLTENTGASIANYAANHPGSGLDPIVARYPEELLGIRKWVRRHGRQTSKLARTGGGFPWP